MNRRSIYRLLVWALLLTGCANSAPPSPTPQAVNGAGEAAVALIQQDMYIRLTKQAIDNAQIEMGARMTATKQVIDATATAARYELDARQTQRAESATQQAWQVTVSAAQAQDAATAQAQALNATAQAQEHGTATQMAVIGLTATISAQGTAEAAKQTQAAPMVWAQQTAVFAEARKTEIELQKSQATMWAMAWGPIALIVVLTAAGLFVLWKKSQVGVISDDDGRVRIVMINQRALQPALMHGPVIDFSDGQVVTAPNLGVTDDMQRQIGHETKIVEAIEALPPGYQRPGLGLVSGLSTQAPPSVNIQVVQPGRVNDWLDDVQGQIAQHVEEDE